MNPSINTQNNDSYINLNQNIAPNNLLFNNMNYQKQINPMLQMNFNNAQAIQKKIKSYLPLGATPI